MNSLARPADQLTVTGLAAGYGDTPTITDVDLTVSRAEIVTVLGPNGAGKSTLLKAVLGAKEAMPVSGRAYVMAGGRVVLSGRADALPARSDLGEVFLGRTGG